MKPINIAIIVLVLLILALGGYFFYERRNDSKILASDNTGGNDDAYTPVTPEQVYSQGADDQRKQDETRARAALLTGGFSEVGRIFGWKPFG